MTLRPHDQHNRFVAHEEPQPDLGVCCVPRCVKPATDRHHIWARSALGKPADVVRDVETEELLPNIAVVCREHHKDLTGRMGGHAARIVWNDLEGLFFWHERALVRPLDPQPSLPRRSPVQEAELLRAMGRDEDADLLERGAA